MSGRILLAIGTLVFFHAAYSTYEHLSLRKSVGLDASAGMPTDITVEALVSLLVLTLGCALTAAPLKPITWASEMRTRTIDQIDARPGFAPLNLQR